MKKYLTIGQITELKPVFEKLFNIPAKELGTELLLNIISFSKNLDSSLQKYSEARNKIIRDYNFKGEDGVNRVPNEKIEEFNKLIEGLIKSDSDVKMPTISFSKNEIETLQKFLNVGAIFTLTETGFINIDELKEVPEEIKK